MMGKHNQYSAVDFFRKYFFNIVQPNFKLKLSCISLIFIFKMPSIQSIKHLFYADYIVISVLNKDQRPKTKAVGIHIILILWTYYLCMNLRTPKNKFHNQNMLMLYVYWERYWIRVYFEIIKWINYVGNVIAEHTTYIGIWSLYIG